jgi:SAM-dependent methyltransferase
MTSSDEASMTSGYARYLAAKTTVDDRALNGHVLAELRRLMPAGAPRVLEVGAGLGTMVARLIDWGVVGTGEYILLDTDRQLLDHSRRWLAIGRPRGAYAATCCRMGCRSVICGCAWCTPSLKATWRPITGR